MLRYFLRCSVALWACSSLAPALEDLGGCAEDVATNMVQRGVALHRRGLQRAPSADYWYPSRGVNDNRSGWTAALGPFPLRAPTWQYEVPGLNFHQTPCIDDKFNVYTGSDNGVILSFTKLGQKRWEFNATAIGCQNPTILDGLLYVGCRSGEVLALKMDNGHQVWSRKIVDLLPTDAWTLAARYDYLVVPLGDSGQPFGGTWGVAVLDRKDGQTRWTYNVTQHSDPQTFVINNAPCLLDDSIIISDTTGGVFRLSLKDGSEMWKVPGMHAGTFTLGGVACAEHLAFNGFAKKDQSGALQAINISNGKPFWMTNFSRVIHNAPAVGQLYGYDWQVGVIVGEGEPADFPSDKPANITGKVYAVDALSGKTMWTFEPPAWLHTGAAGSTVDQICLPDLFSAATISGDGTVYINWSAGGITYALRDANMDGVVDLEDPKEVSAYDLGSGATGPPAVAPGMLFVNTCRRPSAFFQG